MWRFFSKAPSQQHFQHVLSAASATTSGERAKALNEALSSLEAALKPFSALVMGFYHSVLLGMQPILTGFFAFAIWTFLS